MQWKILRERLSLSLITEPEMKLVAFRCCRSVLLHSQKIPLPFTILLHHLVENRHRRSFYPYPRQILSWTVTLYLPSRQDASSWVHILYNRRDSERESIFKCIISRKIFGELNHRIFQQENSNLQSDSLESGKQLYI